MGQFGHSLRMTVENTDRLKIVARDSVAMGDCLLVRTRNSLYTIRVLDDGMCLVSGGWFDKRGLSPVKIKVIGCTWGGKNIKADALAACGLCLEFANRVTTSEIQKIYIFPTYRQN